jgi:hypothetical protein
MDDKEKQIKDWDKFLNTDEIKNNLVRTSFYLLSFELLKNTIVDKIKDFYLTGFDEAGYIYSNDYNEKVVNKKINGKQNIFLSSLHWLEERAAISADDITEINIIREKRNTVAHQIDKFLCDSDFNIDTDMEKKMFDYIEKIERWWIREVEIPTNPDFDCKDVSDENILPGKIIIYHYIKSITDELINNKNDKDEGVL